MKLRSALAVPVAVIVALAALCPRAGAAVIYDNLNNPTNSLVPISANSWDAQRFNSDATNLLLTSATLNLSSTAVTPGNYRLSLYSDAANNPGVPIGTLFAGSTASKPPSPTVQFDFAQPMAPNTNYWIVLSVDVGQPTTLQWSLSTTNTGTGSGFQLPSRGSANQGTSWFDRTVPHRMQLTAVVPEPTGVALVMLVTAGLFTRRRTRVRTRAHQC